MYIEKILDKNKYFFLGRPRRFGKSLFLSTLKCFFEGRRELFKGLYADTMDWDWEPRPVFHIDLNVGEYNDDSHLNKRLNRHLEKWEAIYGDEFKDREISERFEHIIEKAYKASGKEVVILVDEYDKPLISALGDTPEQKKLFATYQSQLAAFYSNFKSSSDYIRLVFLTGVSRFGKLSVFSGLNNLKDISFDKKYSSICGVSAAELDKYLIPGVKELAEEDGSSLDDTMEELKQYYDGYHFSEKSEDIYNPFSLLNALDATAIRNYWIQSGSAKLICDQLSRYDVDIKSILNARCAQEALVGIDLDARSPLALLYQTGYLTIKDYDRTTKLYTLGIPNEEVKRGFLNYLLPYYSNLNKDESPFVVTEFVNEFREGKVDSFMSRLQKMFAKTTYRLKLENENNFQNALYILMMLVGLYVQAELCTSDGRIDLFVATDKFYYIIELKVDSTPEEALRQIEEKNYSLPFTLDDRKVIKIGANFSTETRTLTAWKTAE